MVIVFTVCNSKYAMNSMESKKMENKTSSLEAKAGSADRLHWKRRKNQ
ncbi:MAG: hypothetical protein Q8Q35_01275 [Nanoarchaeota archaeon]|nr:hypothetical protein [Nanoarchaeota archaeon]